MSSKLAQFSEKVVHCQNSQCSYRQDCPGRYPKFSYGNTDSKLMAVFQNPGKPTFDELKKDINNVTVDEMRQWAGEGVKSWLFGLRGLPRTLFNFGDHNFLESYYLTQAYRCPDPMDEAFANRERAHARTKCLHYLREEISIIRPTAVLAFGKDALRSVRDVLSPETPVREISRLKTLFQSRTIFEWNSVRVCPIVHPDGYWKSPSIPTGEYQDIIQWYIRQIRN